MLRMNKLHRILLIGILVILITSQADIVSAGVNVWTSNGPIDGGINVLVIDPQTPAILYAGTSRDGVFKSTNNGENWSALNAGLTTTEVLVLAIDPKTPTTLYAGTDGGGVFSIQQIKVNDRIFLPHVRHE